MMLANVDKSGVGERKTKSSLNEQTIEQTIARIELDISNQQNKPKLQPGQQSVKSYFKVMDRQTQPKSCFRDGTEDLRTNDTVTSDEGRKRLIVLGSDVVGLFPAMKEVNTGKAVGKQVLKVTPGCEGG